MNLVLTEVLSYGLCLYTYFIWASQTAAAPGSQTKIHYGIPQRSHAAKILYDVCLHHTRLNTH